MKVLLQLSLSLLCAPALLGDYSIETITFPKDVPVEVGALEFDQEGDLYCALRRGDIFVATPQKDPTAFQWRHFASGFHNPCGIHIIKPGHVIIAQMAELTEVIDTDDDQVADVYRALSTDFGLSGNYHETMDICPDGEGGLYLAPGTASHNGPTFTTVRGPYSDAGRLGRNFSAVQSRGCVVHWQPGQPLTRLANGFRMHNGIERSPAGDLWCGDNQGDWRSSSPVYHITEDSFAGHPSSLVWDERFAGISNPMRLPRLLLDDLWNKPAFRLPRNMINSCAEPAFVPEKGSFAPFEGQLLIPDQSGNRIIRCMPEWIDSNYQGAATTFVQNKELHRGNNRLAFSPDGSALYTGQTGRGWGKLSEGLQRITPPESAGLEVQNCQLTEDGFLIIFTQPINLPSSLNVERYRYSYGYQYGGEELEKETFSIKPTQPAANTLHLPFTPAQLLPNYVYRFQLRPVSTTDGETFTNHLVYTLNRLKRPPSQTTTITQTDGNFRITIDGELFTEYLTDYETEGFTNPILYPIQNASGTPLTRDFPINPPGRRNESRDHPHHKALFIGHESINGIDFWHSTRPGSGRIEHARTIETRSGEDRALLRTFNLWKDAEDSVICTDTRELQFGVTDGIRYLDLELNLHASHRPVVFGEKKDGVIAIRTHPDLRLTADPARGVKEVFGNAQNSEGVQGKKIWGKKAHWVHYWGQIDGQDSGIAILAHPSNKRGPTWWHARDYGLIAANPFGPTANGGDGALTLAEGESFTMRYRFLFHDKSEIDIEKLYQQYAQAPLVPRTLCLPIPPEDLTLSRSTWIPKGDVLGQVIRTRKGQPAEPPKIHRHGFGEGSLVYSDRDFRFQKVPPHLRGADYLATYNDDKKAELPAHYEVTVTQPATLYLLVDTRIQSKISWLKQNTATGLFFEKTGDRVTTDANFQFQVYQAEADPGTYRLRNQQGGSFYVLLGVNRD